MLRLVVDYCKSAQVTEDPQNSAADRRPCEAKADIPGYPYHRHLNVYTPLELGGRSKPDANYPRGLSNVGFDGCIKNVRHNSIVSKSSATHILFQAQLFYVEIILFFCSPSIMELSGSTCYIILGKSFES